MHFILLALISAITVNEVPLDVGPIENSENQWLAPGYSIAEEILIDPIEYGTPLVYFTNIRGEISECRNVIGVQCSFIDTSDGEKWRITLAYEGKVVILQEDEEPLEYEVDLSRTIGESIHAQYSQNGRFLYLRQRIDRSYNPPPEWILYRNDEILIETSSVLLDIESGNQIASGEDNYINHIGVDGYMISTSNDSLSFYDNRFNLLNSYYEGPLSVYRHIAGSFASDGSLLVREFNRESPEDSIYTLRAYDKYGNVLWDSYPPNVGWPVVSEHGDFVLVLALGRLMCLNGNNGELLWEQSVEWQGGGCLRGSSRRGLASALTVDGTPDEARENPMRNRMLCITRIDQNGNSNILKLIFQSEMIRFFSPIILASSGSSLWRVYLGPDRDLSNYQLCLFSSDGALLFVLPVSETDRRYRPIPGLESYAISSDGRRIIWYDRKEIHILTLVEEGLSW